MHLIRNRILFFGAALMAGLGSMWLHRTMMTACIDENGLLISGSLPEILLWGLGITFLVFLLVLFDVKILLHTEKKTVALMQEQTLRRLRDLDRKHISSVQASFVFPVAKRPLTIQAFTLKAMTLRRSFLTFSVILRRTLPIKVHQALVVRFRNMDFPRQQRNVALVLPLS